MIKNNALYVLVLVALSVASISASAATRINIAAIVGDDLITTTDVNERRDLIMATNNIPATVENQQRVSTRILQSLIDETLQLQEAKRQSITVTEEELKQAVDQMRARDTGESVREFVKKRGLSERTLENQVRADLAWTKVVQRKLKRNVSISQDEIARAQQAAIAAPPQVEMRIQALEFLIKDASKDAAITQQAQDAAAALKAGKSMSSIAAQLVQSGTVRYSQPTWVVESNLPPALQQVLTSIPAGGYTTPIRGGEVIQILQVMERKSAERMADGTDYTLKQISISVPESRDKASLAKLTAAAAAVQTNPGSCTEETTPAISLPATVEFVHAKYGELNAQQRQVIAHLQVGDISEPLLSADALRLIVVCEKVEPVDGNLPDADKIRQALFAEKLELEAQKLLRNLRRDAYIDIKSAQ